MNKQQLKKIPAVLMILALVITAAAWQGQPGKFSHNSNDTVPDKKIKNIDDAIEQLDRSREEVERTFRDKDWEKQMKEALDKAHFDTEKMKQQIDEAMKNIDAEKIQLQVQNAMKEVDFEKIKNQLQESLNKVDMAEVKEQIAQAMKQVDAEKIKADIDASISKIDVEKIKAEMDRVKETDFKKMEENLKNMGPEIEKSMKSAKESIEKAKKEMLAYKAFIEDLDRDGLINKDESYDVRYKNGVLSINGKEQSAGVTSKYSSFLKGRKNFHIEKDEDHFNIHNDE